MNKYNTKQHTCVECGKSFSGRKKKYCSKECSDEVRRRKNRERWRKNNTPKPDVTINCEWCGKEHTVPARTAHQARFCSDECRYTYRSRVVEGRINWEEYAKKRKVRSLIKLIKNEINRRESLITKTCSECGKEFYTTTKQRKTCSKECSRKRKNRRKRERELERMNNAVIDRDISLDRLYSRDKGICYICGGKCDFKDYEERNGHFIAGSKYPSIDHVIPLARGGKHAWDNVKLAHHHCNSTKSDVLPSVLGLSVEIKNAYAVAERKIPNKKEVMQLTRKGNIINVFESTAEASRQTGIKAKGIQKCARGECPTYRGYVWKYI